MNENGRKIIIKTKSYGINERSRLNGSVKFNDDEFFLWHFRFFWRSLLSVWPCCLVWKYLLSLNVLSVAYWVDLKLKIIFIEITGSSFIKIWIDFACSALTNWIEIFTGWFLVRRTIIQFGTIVCIIAGYCANYCIVTGIFIRYFWFTVAIWFCIILIDQLTNGCHWCDGWFWKQAFSLFEFAISFVCFGIGALIWCQISIPTAYYIPI